MDQSTSSGRHTAGNVLMGLGSLVLLASAATKFAGLPQVVAQLGAFGFDGAKVTLIAIAEVLSALLFLHPRTRSAGLLLVSAFLGGAIATHMQHGEPLRAPAGVLALLWLGAWLRHPDVLWSAPSGGWRTTFNLQGATMNFWIRRSIWLSRFVLGAATLLLLRIGLGYVLNPVGEAALHRITLGSTEAITIMRVQGSVFIGIAVLLAASVVSRRMLVGLALLATVVVAITAVRLVGLAVDGPAPFTLMVLKPEVVLVALSTLALFFERRRALAASPEPRASL